LIGRHILRLLESGSRKVPCHVFCMQAARDQAHQMHVQGEGFELDPFRSPDNPLIHLRSTGEAVLWKMNGVGELPDGSGGLPDVSGAVTLRCRPGGVDADPWQGHALYRLPWQHWNADGHLRLPEIDGEHPPTRTHTHFVPLASFCALSRAMWRVIVQASKA
jgi:hypothetical protein